MISWDPDVVAAFLGSAPIAPGGGDTQIAFEADFGDDSLALLVEPYNERVEIELSGGADASPSALHVLDCVRITRGREPPTDADVLLFSSPRVEYWFRLVKQGAAIRLESSFELEEADDDAKAAITSRQRHVLSPGGCAVAVLVVFLIIVIIGIVASYVAP